MFKSLAKRLGRLYPLVSGCGTFANLRLFRALDPAGGPDEWARVGPYEALVPAGDYTARAIKFVGDIDRKVTFVAQSALSAGDSVLDIGANLGLVTLKTAAVVGSSGAIHSFEPQPRLQSYLQLTIEKNGLDNVTLHCMALGPEECSMHLSVPGHNMGAASLVSKGDGSRQTIEVPVKRLDDVVTQYGLRNIAFVKIDVEGFEKEVLRGAGNLLANDPPAVILLEEHARATPDNMPESLQILADAGYELFALPKSLFRVRLAPLSEGVDCHDYVAIGPTATEAVRKRLKI